MASLMRRRLVRIETRVLPHGWMDAVRQLLLAAGAYALYELVRGVAGGGGTYKPFGDATRIIDLERGLHVFVEPSIQAWTLSQHWLTEFAAWTYLNTHYFVTLAVLIFLYLRRNDSFYFVRNVFMISMAIALVGYAFFPTAPPRLFPEWGFTDSIRQLTGVNVERGPTSAFLNLYAAVPSMHVCFAIMVGWPMFRLTHRRPVKILWLLYPVLIMFVVVATGNHYLTDVFLGGVTAGASWMLAGRLLARARPDTWRFHQATAA